MAGFSFGNFKLHACFRPTSSSKWNHEQPASRISNNVLQSSISQKHCICLEVFKDADPSTPLGYWFSNPAAHRSHLDRSLRSARCELRDRMRTEKKTRMNEARVSDPCDCLMPLLRHHLPDATRSWHRQRVDWNPGLPERDRKRRPWQRASWVSTRDHGTWYTGKEGSRRLFSVGVCSCDLCKMSSLTL